MKKIIILFISLIFGISIILFSKEYLRRDGMLKFHDWKSVDNLMIVAHPDDETLWGSEELLNNKYLVVCITCGKNKKRLNEIENALKISDDKLIILDKPDKVKGKRSDWKKYKKQIETELNYIITKKEWNKIVTHNPNGEYGHNHHKMTSDIVTKLCIKNHINNLIYFGKYYSKKRIDENKGSRELPNNIYENKMKMIDVYKSQKFVKDYFGQMFKYENLIDSKDWK